MVPRADAYHASMLAPRNQQERSARGAAQPSALTAADNNNKDVGTPTANNNNHNNNNHNNNYGVCP
jgi:hypothetical protein